MAGFDKVVTSYADAMAGLNNNMTIIAVDLVMWDPRRLIAQIKQ